VEILKFNTHEELSYEAGNYLRKLLSREDIKMISLAAGETPIATYQELVNDLPDLSQKTFVGLDEWVGLNGSVRGSCYETLDNSVFNPWNVKKKQIHFFNGKSKNLLSQCDEINELLKKKYLDLIVLGLGLNGHLGFNEPGSSFDSLARVVDLSETTVRVGQKYFDRKMKLSRGLTIGLSQIKEAKHIMLLVKGEHKKEILNRFLTGEVSEQIPATVLRGLDQCRVFIS